MRASGHIHHAEMRLIDGVLYCNDGDWVESLSALVEHGDGRLELIDWAAHRRAAARACDAYELARTSSLVVTPASTFSIPS